MPRFHLHQHRDGAVVVDDEGGEYASLEDAVEDAAQSAREIMADRLRQGEPIDGSEFHIMNEAGRIIAVVTFGDVAAGKPFPPAPALAR
jgi:hypothetical protein